MNKLTFLLTLLIFLTGCSGTPSGSAIEEELTEKLTRDGLTELFTIENFEKTDGLEKDDSTYIAYVEYDLVANMSLDEYTQGLKGKSDSSPLDGMRAGLGVMALKLQYGDFKSGHTIHKEEKVTFFKTEKGWRIQE